MFFFLNGSCTTLLFLAERNVLKTLYIYIYIYIYKRKKESEKKEKKESIFTKRIFISLKIITLFQATQ